MQSMQKCQNSNKKQIARQKIKTKNDNNNSSSSLCEVKWYNYLVVVEMILLNESPRQHSPPLAPNVPQLQLFGKYGDDDDDIMKCQVAADDRHTYM